jgi:hypothetical protein
MIKKKLTLIIVSLAFFSSKTFAQKEKKKTDKESSAKVETKGADIKKEPKPYKKLLIQLQLRKRTD